MHVSTQRKEAVRKQAECTVAATYLWVGQLSVLETLGLTAGKEGDQLRFNSVLPLSFPPSLESFLCCHARFTL